MEKFSKYMLMEAKSIINASEKIKEHDIAVILDYLEECKKNKSKLILTGVGKSGIVAKKIASTFCSLGIMSLYLNPLDSLHGDIGIVDKRDLVIVLSNSGETNELLTILPYLSSRGVKIVSILGNDTSTIAKHSQVVLDASVEREVCPLNLAPTASTIVAMAIGDCLAAAWIERSKLSETDFAINHPAGSLGKRLTLKCKDIMLKPGEFDLVQLETAFSDIISSITTYGIGATIVEYQKGLNKIEGIITDGDIRRALQAKKNIDLKNIKAKDIMSNNPVCIDQEELAIIALEIMENNSKGEISILPVVDDNKKILGLLRLHDLIKSGL